MITVTKTFLPPQAEYESILSRAWKSGWITNRGELVKELEKELKDYLGVPNMICMTNGTLPLQIAIKALGLTGEIITTPFSYVATTSSIVWEGCTPVFVDIHPEYLTIDEDKIEEAITKRTSAIMATHVYGNPCNVEVIEMIAKRHNLKVIYDAAHCFGIEYKGQSLLNYGDISTLSFHATKLFHTGEGGGVVCNSGDFEEVYYRHNFGHLNAEEFHCLGINGKMSELQAAMGLAVLPHVDELIRRRKKACEYYDSYLVNNTFKYRNHTKHNYSYYPLVFSSEERLSATLERLKALQIFPRRYFYPSLDVLYSPNSKSCPVSDDISKRIVCLPLSHDLTIQELELITENIIIE